MLKKRVIPCLDVKGGSVVKGVQFENLKYLGDPAEAAEMYMNGGADELVFLDISASEEGRRTRKEWVHAVADKLFVPFTVGGGIGSPEEARDIVALGADKISINTKAISDPDLIKRCALLLGSQAVVLAIDAKATKDGKWEVYAKGGTVPTGKDAVEWARQGCSLGAGEILLTSIDRDGTDLGYDLNLIEAIRQAVDVPIIASGGAGSLHHFAEAIRAGADAVLAASVFHFGIYSISQVKEAIEKEGFPVRKVW
ncbi:imidazole glycerol phosphate synthase subunit hisF [Acetomicrobium flavidum]|uniref:Imidazole glycerol phosphate synthase subunit HisF n=1 Tax=Acetomicrobium flavidum TaxID=49896 RepID=A0ABY1JBL3_9BACT|nr:imidazole glycerol phosphate synthase subunit hisF [Acetomicrobium flavidum]